MSSALGFDPGLNLRWRDAVDAFKLQAAAAWPQEAVALIRTDGSLLPCANIHPEPERAFRVDQAIVEAQLIAGTLAAVLHSHPSTPDGPNGEIPANDFPSASDIAHQMTTAVPWGICMVYRGGAAEPFWFGDQVPMAPLHERPFRHYVADCYALIRDWHRAKAKITLLDLPREMGWWDHREDQVNPDFYARFEEAGFKRVHRDPSALAPGDCFICKVRSPVLNHAGVYVGSGKILHHLYGHLSMEQAAHVWRPKLDLIVRHEDLPEGWSPP